MTDDNRSHILTHLGENRADHWGAVSPPLVQTTNFSFETVADFRKAMHDEKANHLYTRGSNPTIDTLNTKLAALEGAEDALTVASGSAAVAMAVMANVKQGDHIICIDHVYSWTDKLLNRLLARFGVEVTMVDGKAVGNFEAAIQPNTRIIFLESPNSLLFEMQDVEAVCALAKQHGILTIMDNTYASPVSKSAIAMGVDITVHSATKHIAGHSDAVAGLICGTREMITHIFHNEFMTLGGIISPFNAWLLLRSLRTLPMRVERSGKTTEKVVAFLDAHPKVNVVHWPFLPSHPQHHLAQKQFDRPMPMFSIEVAAADVPAVEKMVNALNFFLIAASWGGYESLVIPACGLKGHDLPFNLLRLAIGFEDADVLIDDLSQALDLL